MRVNAPPALIFLLLPLMAADQTAAMLDPAVEQILLSQNLTPVVVALHLESGVPRPEAIEAAAASLSSVPGISIRAKFRNVPAVVAAVTAQGLEALLRSRHVAGVEADDGGYGLFIPREAVNKLDHVAILDTGVGLNSPFTADKLVAESCYCVSREGSGCCPDGSPVQQGPGSAQDYLPFATTSGAWLEPAKPVDSNVVSWAPAIHVLKVLSRADRFHSWQPVLAALDEHLNRDSVNLNRILLSFASARLYEEPDCGTSPIAAILRDTLGELVRQGVTPMAARATGGPGPGSALPGCLGIARQPAGAVVERWPEPQPGGERTLMAMNQRSDAPPAPIPANASVVYGIIEAITPLDDADAPPIDTPADAKWFSVRVKVIESAPVKTGTANFIPRDQSLVFATFEPVAGLVTGGKVKFTAAQTGSNVRQMLYATGFRPVAPPAKPTRKRSR